MALNKVAPTSAAPITRVEGGDAKLNAQSSTGRTAEGIFTVASSHYGALTGPSNDRHSRTHRRSDGMLGCRFLSSPERTVSDTHGRVCLGLHRNPTSVVSAAATCSDENDIDVTVDKDDVASVNGDDLERRDLANSEYSDGFGLETEDCIIAKEARYSNPAPSSSVHGESSPVAREAGKFKPPRGQPRSTFKVSFGPTPSYDIYLVPGSQPDSITLHRKRSLYSMKTGRAKHDKSGSKPSEHVEQRQGLSCSLVAHNGCQPHTPNPAVRHSAGVSGSGAGLARSASANPIHDSSDVKPGSGSKRGGRTDCSQPVENSPMSPAESFATGSRYKTSVSFRGTSATSGGCIRYSDLKSVSNEEETSRPISPGGLVSLLSADRLVPSSNQSAPPHRRHAPALNQPTPSRGRRTPSPYQPSSSQSGPTPSPYNPKPSQSGRTLSTYQSTHQNRPTLSPYQPIPSQSRLTPSPNEPKTSKSRQIPSHHPPPPSQSRLTPSPMYPTSSVGMMTCSFNPTRPSSGRLAPSPRAEVTSLTRIQDPHSQRFTRQIRVAKILLMVTGGFLLCFLPFWGLTLAYMASPHLDWHLNPVQSMFISMLYQSYFINNALNPVLFAIYSPEFRKECGVLLGHFCKRFCGK